MATKKYPPPDPNSPSNDLAPRGNLPEKNATEEAWERRKAAKKAPPKAPFSNDTVEGAAKRGAIRESAYADGGKIGKLVKTGKLAPVVGGKPVAHAGNVSGCLHGRANGGKVGRR